MYETTYNYDRDDSHRYGQGRNFTAGCFTEICEPWTFDPPVCNDICTSEDDQALLVQYQTIIADWLFDETGQQFPGHCAAETEPCPPCGCRQYCQCGSWDLQDLDGAFCHPIVTDPASGAPYLDFSFDNGSNIIGHGSGTWTLLPDLKTVRWCQSPDGSGCGGFPRQDVCGSPWTMRAIVGARPPDILIQGASRLACEFLKEHKGLDNCLPDGVRSITRRNITADVGPGFSETISFDNQGTGIPILDLALRRYGRQAQPVRFSINPMDRILRSQRRKWSYYGKLQPTAPSNWSG